MWGGVGDRLVTWKKELRPKTVKEGGHKGNKESSTKGGKKNYKKILTT